VLGHRERYNHDISLSRQTSHVFLVDHG
jgi:hypothetical protein